MTRFFWLLCAAVLTLASARGETARFELRGIMDLGSGPSFSVLDTETASSFWIKLGRQIGSVEASSYDSAEGILTLQEGGLTHRLRLVTANDTPLEVMTTSLVEAKREAQESWVRSPVRNPRLAHTIRDRRSAGSIKQPKMTTSGSLATVSRGATSSQATDQNEAANKTVEATQIAKIGNLEDSGMANHANPRVLVARKNAR